jgi:hypothetical protein
MSRSLRIRSGSIFACLLTAIAFTGCGGGDSPAATPADNAPRITACSASPEALAPGGAVVLVAATVDDDGDVVRILWSAEAGVFPSGNEGPTVGWTAPAEPGAVRIFVTASDATHAVSDTLTVDVVTTPVLHHAPSALDFGAADTVLDLEISNPGTGGLTWHAATEASWLVLAPVDGLVDDDVDTVVVTADRSGLAPGSHAASIRLTSDAGDADVAVVLTVPEPEPVLGLSATQLDFGATDTERPLRITNAGGGTLTWTAADAASWLAAAPAAGETTVETDTLVVTVDRTGLAPGPHAATLQLTSNGGNAGVAVTLSVPEPDPVLGLSTASLDFGETAVERVFQLVNDGGGVLEWTLTSAASWLGFAPFTGSTTGETELVAVTADRTGLSVGRHEASLTVTSNGGDRVLDVTLDVADGPVVLRNLFFLHHSTGRNLIAEGNVRAQIAAIDPAFDFWDHDYNAIGLKNPDGVLTGESYNVPNDNTDPDGLYVLWTTNNSARTRILADHQVIAFKSCYPASDITSDAMLQQYKTWYLAIRDVLAAHPDHRFLIMGFPPRHRLATTASQAARARAFNTWLGSAAFLDGHPNLTFFDFFDRLANPDDGSAAANMLRYAYERSHTESDSHPNAAANAAVGPPFAAALTDAAGR